MEAIAAIRKCIHPKIMHGVCTECGDVFEQYGEAGHYRSHGRTLLPELQKYNFPDEINMKADEIFQRMETSIRRGNIRQHLIFYCVYNAYHELGINKNPRQIAITIGIDPGEITKALSKFSESQEMYQPPLVTSSPLDFLPDFARQIQLSDDSISSVIELAQEILEKDPELLEGYPQKVAAGILRYFLTIHGISFRKNLYAGVIGLSEVTINNMYKRICKIHNS